MQALVFRTLIAWSFMLLSACGGAAPAPDSPLTGITVAPGHADQTTSPLAGHQQPQRTPDSDPDGSTSNPAGVRVDLYVPNGWFTADQNGSVMILRRGTTERFSTDGVLLVGVAERDATHISDHAAALLFAHQIKAGGFSEARPTVVAERPFGMSVSFLGTRSGESEVVEGLAVIVAGSASERDELFLFVYAEWSPNPEWADIPEVVESIATRSFLRRLP